ncbi:MAG: hypothetical protein ACK4WC_11650, partial [Rubrimonas sp.]
MQATATRSTPAGRGAGKYDVLSALALAGLGGRGLPPQRALRLIALITTRYNWAADSLSVGHDELTRLWGVSRRTVIREIDALREAGVLTVLRPGRKGRVTAYRLNPAAVRAVAAGALGADPTGVDARLAMLAAADAQDAAVPADRASLAPPPGALPPPEDTGVRYHKRPIARLCAGRASGTAGLGAVRHPEQLAHPRFGAA